MVSLTYAEPSWIGIPQHVFMDWACDDTKPLAVWQRVQYLALARCDETGIAVFRKGELAQLVYGGPDTNRNLAHHIALAVKHEVLHPESRRESLRVPEHVFRSGPSAGYLKRVAR